MFSRKSESDGFSADVSYSTAFEISSSTFSRRSDVSPFSSAAISIASYPESSIVIRTSSETLSGFSRAKSLSFSISLTNGINLPCEDDVCVYLSQFSITENILTPSFSAIISIEPSVASPILRFGSFMIRRRRRSSS